MTPHLETALTDLDGLQSELLDLGMRTMKAYGGAVYPLDLLANAATKRALSLNSAFTLLLRADNFLAAAHLVRLQLDSVLRLSAAWIVDDCHKFARAVLKGVSVRDQRDRAGKRMTDKYLVELLSKDEPWVLRVYNATSGYIHLSEKHIFNTLYPPERPDTITIELSAQSGPVGDASKIEAALAMTAITRLLQRYLEGWCRTKAEPGKKPNQVVEPTSAAAPAAHGRRWATP